MQPKPSLPSSQCRGYFNNSHFAFANLNDLGPASRLQVCEGRVQDLFLSWKRREPLQLSSTLQSIPSQDPEDQRLVADAVRHCCFYVCGCRHWSELRVCVCMCLCACCVLDM
jgi:hypothetical protein